MISRSSLDHQVTVDDVSWLFEKILRRPFNDLQYALRVANSGISLRTLIGEIRSSHEYEVRNGSEYLAEVKRPLRQSLHYRCPDDLATSLSEPRRVLVVGSCLSERWMGEIAKGRAPCQFDFYLFGGELPKDPLSPPAEYDFCIVQVPLRSVLPDNAFARLDHFDTDGHKRLLDHCMEAGRNLLSQALVWTKKHGIITFILPFIVPQQNLVGRLLPRYGIRNPVYFIEKLNEAMARQLSEYASAYFFDLNEVLATYGKRLAQEDIAVSMNHGSFASDYDFSHDGNHRIEPPNRFSDVYEIEVGPMLVLAWEELLGMLRTIQQVDTVKMVVLDLDDTLWRGVAAEINHEARPTTEGWPRGLWEALLILKRRGVLLAINSQNNEAEVLKIWDEIFERQLLLNDFAIVRIDWRPKSDKMAEILAAANLLPENVLYIDDNPAQRAEVLRAFPSLRSLGGDPFVWRHILLWSPETQVARVSKESASRAKTVQGQVKRELARDTQPREAFLMSLAVRLKFFQIDHHHPRFGRMSELINRTNQFNTTGQRWSDTQLIAALTTGSRAYAFDVSDVYTDYGLVGAMLVKESEVLQFVMSCRVMGLDAELAAIARIVDILGAEGRREAIGRIAETARNLPCRHLFQRCGFTLRGDIWVYRTAIPLRHPAHINVLDM